MGKHWRSVPFDAVSRRTRGGFRDAPRRSRLAPPTAGRRGRARATVDRGAGLSSSWPSGSNVGTARARMTGRIRPPTRRDRPTAAARCPSPESARFPRRPVRGGAPGRTSPGRLPSGPCRPPRPAADPRNQYEYGADRLVGPEEDVAILLSRLAEALGGAGRLVVVNGPAGIGKTRLVEDLTAGNECPSRPSLDDRGRSSLPVGIRQSEGAGAWPCHRERTQFVGDAYFRRQGQARWRRPTRTALYSSISVPSGSAM
ncbi:hypothetical protein Franean1_3794 [Parafrankia sp. EAN1pec]|nr:hypothetical protein Franean1_3794 [Frankia sp. EAN1pec]